MNRIVFITPEETPYGFAIAGFEQILTDSGSVIENLNQCVEDADVGVVIIDERLFGAIDEKIIQRLQQQWQGIVLVLPSPAGAPSVEEDYLKRLIRRALGYHVRIRA